MSKLLFKNNPVFVDVSIAHSKGMIFGKYFTISLFSPNGLSIDWLSKRFVSPPIPSRTLVRTKLANSMIKIVFYNRKFLFTLQTLKNISREVWGVAGDIANYFPNINHNIFIIYQGVKHEKQ
jgi:hypothetical protein